MTAVVATPSSLPTGDERRAQVLAPSPGAVRRAEHRRARRVGIVLAVVVVGLLGYSMLFGELNIAVADVFKGILGDLEGIKGHAVRNWRLPRVLTALLVGAGLGCSGAVFQSLARNPLASPDIIGISSGASAAAVYLIIFANVSSYAKVSVGALVGGLLTATVIYVMAYRKGLSSYRLVLIGIGISAMLTAATNYMLTRADQFDAMKAMVWITGSLNNRGWQHVVPLSIATAILLPTLLWITPHLRLLQLGDDTALGLGVNAERTRAIAIGVAVAFASLATAAAGPITFVAFVAPPIARRLTRQPLTILPAALVGATVLLASDLIGRRIFAPRELPVGVVTGLIGAPYLLWLLARANSSGRGG